MKYRNKVFKILKDTRVWAEKIAKQKNNPDDLMGLCAIASRRIFTELMKIGLNSEIAISDNGECMHAFIIYDGHILDVTATQFGKSRIYVVKATERNLQGSWEPYRRFSSASGLIKHQHKIGWCMDEVTVKGKCDCGHKDED